MPKDRVVRLRVTETEWKQWNGEALASRITLSDLIRKRMGTPPPSRESTARSVPPNSPVLKKECDHAGTVIGRLSGVGTCPKCGEMVLGKELV